MLIPATTLDVHPVSREEPAMTPSPRAATGALILVSHLASASPAAAGALIPVNATTDDLSANGNCTLREALVAANTDAPVDACPPGRGPDTITIPAGVYVLSLAGPREDAASTGDLDVLSDVSVVGAGRAMTTVDGGSRREPSGDRVFHVLAGGHLTLSGVTVRGGYCASGGGILNAGRLDIVASTVKDNVASEVADSCWIPLATGGAGLYNLGELRVTQSTIADNVMFGTLSYSDVASPGGGLYNRGTAVIDRSVVLRNFAASGGGIRNDHDLQVVDSSVANNGARFYGAGLHNTARARLERSSVTGNVDGGILNGFPGGSAVLTLDTVTVSGNDSYRLSGSVHNQGGTVEIRNSTIAANRASLPPAGLFGPARLANTLVANGTGGDCAGPIDSLGFNLDADGSCGLSEPGDLPAADPMLGPLADNGGPTPTHALAAASPALDQIDADRCLASVDQRGVSRPSPQHGACDIGAYERSPSGDITLLIDAVRASRAQGAISEAQERELVASLKTPLQLATSGRLAEACVAIDGFAALVDEYVADGRLAAATAAAWGRAVKRIKYLTCG
jgi:CSLREA domain-containing protein